jgi:hypothetical protein
VQPRHSARLQPRRVPSAGLCRPWPWRSILSTTSGARLAVKSHAGERPLEMLSELPTILSRHTTPTSTRHSTNTSCHYKNNLSLPPDPLRDLPGAPQLLTLPPPQGCNLVIENEELADRLYSTEVTIALNTTLQGPHSLPLQSSQSTDRQRMKSPSP